MKKLLLLTTLMILAPQLKAQDQYNYQDSTKYYSFKVNYWFNMHHFLWLEAMMNVKADSTIIDQQLPQKSKEKLDIALSYYKESLVEEDLRTSDYMTDFKKWITVQQKSLEKVPPKFQQHVEILENFSEVYQEYFWESQRAACINVLEENKALIEKTEEEFVVSITKLTRQFWQFEKLNVDITYVAKATVRNLRNRPYTTLFPSHVVMNAIGENKVKGNWLELLYHESAHHLILSSSYFVGGTIKDLCETLKIKSPRQLGHAYLFYFTGYLTQKLLMNEGIDYPEIYMYRNKVFSRYYPFLIEHLTPYINREITLTDATRRIIKVLEG